MGFFTTNIIKYRNPLNQNHDKEQKKKKEKERFTSKKWMPTSFCTTNMMKYTNPWLLLSWPKSWQQKKHKFELKIWVPVSFCTTKLSNTQAHLNYNPDQNHDS